MEFNLINFSFKVEDQPWGQIVMLNSLNVIGSDCGVLTILAATGWHCLVNFSKTGTTKPPSTVGFLSWAMKRDLALMYWQKTHTHTIKKSFVIMTQFWKSIHYCPLLWLPWWLTYREHLDQRWWTLCLLPSIYLSGKCFWGANLSKIWFCHR